MNGLTDYEVEYRINNGLINNKNVKYSRSIKQIILSNLITLFNIINFALLVLVLTTGSFQNALFVDTVIFNTIVSIIQEIKSKRIMDKLTIVNQDKITVIRDGVKKIISPDEIVLDDVIYLSSGDNVVVDSLIIKSLNCEVDESIITGESDNIIKKKDERLLSGTVITSGSCYARVTSIGCGGYATNLIKDASNIKDNSSYLQKTINKILKIITFIIIPTSILLFISQYFWSGQNYKEAILSTVAGITGMIPSGVVLLTSIALTAGVIKMSKKKVIVQRLNGIETLASVDILCLDKTGTITNGTMSVVDTVIINSKYNLNEIIGNMLSDNDNNATDKALKKYFNKLDNYSKIEEIPFSSSRKYSITKFKEGSFALGALEYITKEDTCNYKDLKKYLDNGNRIISLVELKKNINIVIGFIIIKDNIRTNAKDTLEYFKKQDVEIKIISGDNPLTVSNIMKGLSFGNYSKYISGQDLPEDYNELSNIVNNYSIFGRVTPYQKQQIIKALKEKNTVGMIGDGVNDILALKEADCGIALANGVNAARSASDIVLTESDFGVLPDIVNEGRRVINNIERVASLYLIKTTYSFILSLLSIILSHEYPFYPVQLSLISTVLVGIPSFALALEPNTNKIEPGFIRKVFRNALPSGICVFINIFFLIMLCTIFNKNFDNVRIVVVSLTGLINLRLLYNICKPFTLLRKTLFIACLIIFYQLLFTLPDVFLVTKINFISILLIFIFAFIDKYIIEFLEELYDKIFRKLVKV